MHFELQQSDNIVSLATSSVLVAVDVNVWSATKQDRVVSNEVTNAQALDRNIVEGASIG